MKLQINDSGAWKNFMSFNGESLEEIDDVMYHARLLLNYSDGRVSMRVTDDRNNPLHYLDGPRKNWRRAGHIQKD